MRSSLAALALVGAIAAAPAALADCTCRGRDGTAVELGGTICLNTADGPRLARCEMVQNVSSWRTTGDSCPTVLLSPISRPPLLALCTPAVAAPTPASTLTPPHPA